MSSKKLPKAIDLNRPHFCSWCNRSFAKETTLLTHNCEPKRRHEAQHNPETKLAYSAYSLFNQHTSPRGLTQPVPTYQQFCTSKHYGDFVRFGSWLIEQQVQEIEAYTKWLLKEKRAFKQWSDLHTYREFLTHLLYDETAEQGIQRSLRTIQTWCETQAQSMADFWPLVNTNTATLWITQGKISPWLLYNCTSAVEFLERCTPEQLELIQKIAPIKQWRVRLLRHKQQADLIKSVLCEAGM